MKKQVISLISGILIGATLFGGALAVAAGVQAAPAAFDVSVDGVRADAAAYAIEGRTYLQLRDIAKALDIGLWWDGANRIARLETDKRYDPAYAGPETPSQPAKAYGRTNPAPVNATQKMNVENTLVNFSAELTMTGLVRGDEAWNQIYAANMFNSPPKDGHEYILAKFRIKVDNVADDKAVTLSSALFDCYSADNVEYTDFVFAASLDPAFSGNLYNGSTHEGWVAFQVSRTDSAPKCVFRANYDGSGGLWFSLSK